MITGAQRSNLPQISPKWKIISAKTARNLPKLHESCAPWQKLRGCAKTRKLHLRNIAIFWWDYVVVMVVVAKQFNYFLV